MSTWCEMVEEIQKRNRERERETQEMANWVRQQLLKERSKFMSDFSANEKRLLEINQ